MRITHEADYAVRIVYVLMQSGAHTVAASPRQPTPATATAASAHGAYCPPVDTAVRRKAAAQQTAASAGIRRAHCRAAASRCFMACPSFVPVIVNGESRGSCREMAKEFDFRTLVFSAAIW